MLKEITPVEVMGKLGFKVDQGGNRKKFLDEESKDYCLPMAGLRPLDYGDWGGLFSDGTVVLECGQSVVKIMTGRIHWETGEQGEELTKSLQKRAGLYSQVTVPYMFVLAGDGNNASRPIMIQEKVNGDPLCKTKFGDIFDEKVLNDVKAIWKRNIETLLSERCGDCSGLDVNGNMLLSRLIHLVPWLSKNIVVDTEEKKAVFVDILPPRVDRITSLFAVMALKIGELQIDGAILLKKFSKSITKS